MNKARELSESFNVVSKYSDIVKVILKDLRTEAVLSDAMIKFAEASPKFLMSVMTQEVVNHLGIDTVLDLLEASMKNFEQDVL